MKTERELWGEIYAAMRQKRRELAEEKAGPAPQGLAKAKSGTPTSGPKVRKKRSGSRHVTYHDDSKAYWEFVQMVRAGDYNRD